MSLLGTAQVCRLCEIEEEQLVRFVTEEWILPRERDALQFDEEDLARILLIQELRMDFGVNDEAVPVILHLIDQLNAMLVNEKIRTLFLS